ncbi:SAM-dependent methyltransferase domain protein, partial [Vibrio cholerae HC-81A2]
MAATVLIRQPIAAGSFF